jgi:hypothetical protein
MKWKRREVRDKRTRLREHNIPFDDINGQPPHLEREGGPMPLDGLRHRNRDNGNSRKDQS